MQRLELAEEALSLFKMQDYNRNRKGLPPGCPSNYFAITNQTCNRYELYLRPSEAEVMVQEEVKKYRRMGCTVTALPEGGFRIHDWPEYPQPTQEEETEVMDLRGQEEQEEAQNEEKNGITEPFLPEGRIRIYDHREHQQAMEGVKEIIDLTKEEEVQEEVKNQEKTEYAAAASPEVGFVIYDRPMYLKAAEEMASEVVIDLTEQDEEIFDTIDLTKEEEEEPEQPRKRMKMRRRRMRRLN